MIDRYDLGNLWLFDGVQWLDGGACTRDQMWMHMLAMAMDKVARDRRWLMTYGIPFFDASSINVLIRWVCPSRRVEVVLGDGCYRVIDTTISDEPISEHRNSLLTAVRLADKLFYRKD